MTEQDKKLIQELEIEGLPEEEKKEIIRALYTSLQIRVGRQLADKMDEKLLGDFDKARKKGEDEAEKWLKANFTDYQAIVTEQLEKLKSEIKDKVGQFVSQMQTKH